MLRAGLPLQDRSASLAWEGTAGSGRAGQLRSLRKALLCGSLPFGLKHFGSSAKRKLWQVGKGEGSKDLVPEEGCLLIRAPVEAG